MFIMRCDHVRRCEKLKNSYELSRKYSSIVPKLEELSDARRFIR